MMGQNETAQPTDRVVRKDPSMADFSGLADIATTHGLKEVAAAWVMAVLPLFARLPGVGLDLICVNLADELHPEGIDLGRAPRRRLPTPLLTGAIKQAFERGQVIVTGSVPGQGIPAHSSEIAALVIPLAIFDRVDAVIGVEAKLADTAALAALLSAVQAASGWLVNALSAEEVERADQRLDAAGDVLKTVIVVVEAEGFKGAAQAAVTDLALRFNANRVAFGVFRRNHIRLQAISNASEFKKNLRDARLIEGAMHEAVDQDTTLVWPVLEGVAPPLSAAHSEMNRALDGVSLFTVPLYESDRCYGAILFERPADKPFAPDDLDLIEATVTVIAPILKEKEANDAWLAVKAWRTFKKQIELLLGPEKFARKLMALGAIVLISVFLFGRQMAIVTANAVVEGSTERIISASFDGFIADAPAREGDVVKAGQILVRMDDRDLVLERVRLVTDAAQEQLELDKSIATRDRNQTAIREARVQQSAAKIKLVDIQMGRVELRAPFDGLVISGDLSQSIGASVAKGQPLMTVAPLDDFRVVLAVDESRISSVAPGQIVWLRMTALPDQVFAAHISAVQPVARYGEGKTTYRVLARLDQSEEDLLHGMQGVARVEVGLRPLWSVWFTPVIDRLRLILWSQWPV